MLRRTSLFGLSPIFATVVLFATPARAEEAHTAPHGRVWYGEEMIAPAAVMDGFTAISAGVLAYSYDYETVGAFSMLAFGVGSQLVAPIVHWKHGNALRGFLSLGMHAFFSASSGFAGFFVAAEMCDDAPHYSRPYYCGPQAMGAAFVWAALGNMSATILDSAFLAYEAPRPRVSLARPKGLPVTVQVAPTLLPNQLGVNLLGRF